MAGEESNVFRCERTIRDVPPSTRHTEVCVVRWRLTLAVKRLTYRPNVRARNPQRDHRRVGSIIQIPILSAVHIADVHRPMAEPGLTGHRRGAVHVAYAVFKEHRCNEQHRQHIIPHTAPYAPLLRDIFFVTPLPLTLDVSMIYGN